MEIDIITNKVTKMNINLEKFIRKFGPEYENITKLVALRNEIEKLFEYADANARNGNFKKDPEYLKTLAYAVENSYNSSRNAEFNYTDIKSKVSFYNQTADYFTFNTSLSISHYKFNINIYSFSSTSSTFTPLHPLTVFINHNPAPAEFAYANAKSQCFSAIQNGDGWGSSYNCTKLDFANASYFTKKIENCSNWLIAANNVAEFCNSAFTLDTFYDKNIENDLVEMFKPNDSLPAFIDQNETLNERLVQMFSETLYNLVILKANLSITNDNVEIKNLIGNLVDHFRDLLSAYEDRYGYNHFLSESDNINLVSEVNKLLNSLSQNVTKIYDLSNTWGIDSHKNFYLESPENLELSESGKIAVVIDNPGAAL